MLRAVMLLVLLIMGGRSVAQEGSTLYIVVNLGPFESAEAAVAARDAVDWSVHEGADTIVCTEALAALELQQYLKKLTGGAVSPIVDDDDPPEGFWFLIGNERSNRQVAAQGIQTSGLPAQNFRLLKPADRPVLIFAGADRVGTLYAVYEWLDRQGVRWYGPGEINEEIPDTNRIALSPIEFSGGPAFQTRGFWAWEDRGTPEFIEWMGRNRMNFWTVEQTDPANAKMRGIRLTCGSHDLQHDFIHYDLPYPYSVAEFKAEPGKPDSPHPRPEYRGDVNGDGVLSYGEVHPEWYGLIDGARKFDMRGDFGVNICDSNPHVLDEFFPKVVAALGTGRWQMADILNFWMFDNRKSWCECEACTALGSPTDRNILLVHRLRREILAAREDGRLKRDVEVQFPIYLDTIAAPTRPLPADYDYAHCVPVFFPIRRCFVHVFEDASCEFNAGYLGDYQGWVVDPERHYRGQFMVGEYYNVSRYNHLPVVLDEMMRVDIPYFHRTGVRHFHYMHAPVANWGTRTLTQWQLARMLWDPELDVDALLEDYFAGRYGPAGPRMRVFYEALGRAMNNATEVRYGLQNRLNAGAEELFPGPHLTPEIWEQMMTDLAEARMRLEAVEGGPIALPDRVRARIDEDERLFTYAETMTRFYDRVLAAQRALAQENEAAARAAFEEARPLAAALEADTHNVRFGSSHVNAENGLAASRLAAAWKRLTERFEANVN